MSLKKLSFLLVIGLLVQMSLVLAVVNFRVVVPDGTTFVVGESSAVQVWLDVPDADGIHGAEFNLNDADNYKIQFTSALTGNFFGGLSPTINSAAAGGNGWTYGEEVDSGASLTSAALGRLFAVFTVQSNAPGDTVLSLTGETAYYYNGAGLANLRSTSVSTPVPITVGCPEGQVPSADSESCVVSVPGADVVGPAPATILDTLLTNIRTALTDGSTSQLQKISAIAAALRAYFIAVP